MYSQDITYDGPLELMANTAERQYIFRRIEPEYTKIGTLQPDDSRGAKRLKEPVRFDCGHINHFIDRVEEVYEKHDWGEVVWWEGREISNNSLWDGPNVIRAKRLWRGCGVLVPMMKEPDDIFTALWAIKEISHKSFVVSANHCNYAYRFVCSIYWGLHV